MQIYRQKLAASALMALLLMNTVSVQASLQNDKDGYENRAKDLAKQSGALQQKIE